ncbi:MAG: Flp family type IVb pilin [Candidatus Baltobacteraceae bacterium]
MKTTLMNLVRDDSGATLVEYGLIVSLIAVVCIAVLATVGKNLVTLFTGVGNDV